MENKPTPKWERIDTDTVKYVGNNALEQQVGGQDTASGIYCSE